MDNSVFSYVTDKGLSEKPVVLEGKLFTSTNGTFLIGESGGDYCNLVSWIESPGLGMKIGKRYRITVEEIQ